MFLGLYDSLNSQFVIKVYNIKMDPKAVYKFCPRCGRDLIPQEGNSLKCSGCNIYTFLNAAACAAVIIENEKGEILLSKRKYDPGKDRWDIPGGFCEPYETAEQAAKREMEEELDIQVEIETFIADFPNKYNYQGLEVATLEIFFKGHIIGGTLKAGDDVNEFQFFPKDQVLEQDLWTPNLRQALQAYLQRG